MNIAHKLLQISILLAKDRLVAVLKKMSVTRIASIERHGIPGQELSHHPCDWDSPRSQEKVSVVAKQGPCVARGGAPDQDLAKTIEKGIAILIGSKDRGSLNPEDHYMVERPGCIYS